MSQSNSQEVRVRIAPSPTGDPHVGTAYIGLFNYAFARKHGGKFILRIEDTDQTRSTPESEQMIFRSLRWVGLQWDEGPDIGGEFGPYRQSERLALYQKAAQTLLDKGEAYHCFCKADRLEALRAAQRAAGQPPGYDRTCRALPPEEAAARLAKGDAAVVRLKVPLSGIVPVRDELRGAIEFNVAEIDDQVLMKSDGFPTYHLANVVDDYEMRITHVIRAEEWISSTPKHVLLYRAFGWQPPQFFHMPLLRNADKSKISKRKNPVSLTYYERAGYLPEAMLNYLAMMGWTMSDSREKFSLAEMVEDFSFERISLGGPVFDLAKLTWLNGLYIRDMSDTHLLETLRRHLLTDDYLLRVIPLVRERIEKLEDFMGYSEFFFSGSVAASLKSQMETFIPKGKAAPELKKALDAVMTAFDALAQWDHVTIEQALRQVCEATGFKTKELFMPVRMAITGRVATPPLFETAAVLGKACCRARLKEAIALLP